MFACAARERALATAEDMLIDHVDINQAFLQDDMLEEEGFEGNVYISPPPGYDLRCPTLPRADSKAHTKDLCTTILDAPSHVTSTLAPPPSRKFNTLNACAKSMDNGMSRCPRRS